MQDEEKVLQARRGDAGAYGALVELHGRAAFGLAFAILGTYDAAQDCAQDAFVLAWEKLETLNDPSRFAAWLATIVRRTALDRLRKAKTSREVGWDESAATPAWEETWAVEQAANAVHKALEKLDEASRETAVLYHLGGYKAREIAVVQNITKAAVESRIRRSKKRLQEELLPMKNEIVHRRTAETVAETVLWRIVPRIATLEIPVRDLAASLDWYGHILGTEILHRTEVEALLRLKGAGVGVPALYLVQTEDLQRLTFLNTRTGVRHSVVDFFVPDLARFHRFLSAEKVQVTPIHLLPGMGGRGGFGFDDPDGNSFGASDVVLAGQS